MAIMAMRNFCGVRNRTLVPDNALWRREMGKWTDRIGQGAGCIGGGALLALHLVWGIVRFFAIAGLLNRWFGTQYWPGAICAGIIAEVPIISEVLAVWGGIVHYGLAWPCSALFFAPEVSLTIAIFPVGLIALAIRAAPRPWRAMIIVALVVGAAVAVWAWHPWRVPEMRQIATYRSRDTEYAIRSAVGRRATIEIDCPYMICDYAADNPPDGLAFGEAEYGRATIILDGARAAADFCAWLSRMQQWAATAIEPLATHDDYIQIRARFDRHGSQRLWMGAQYVRGTGPQNQRIIMLVARFRPRGAKSDRYAQITMLLIDPPVDKTSSPGDIIHAINADLMQRQCVPADTRRLP
jgi:hypothetical protein